MAPAALSGPAAPPAGPAPTGPQAGSRPTRPANPADVPSTVAAPPQAPPVAAGRTRVDPPPVAARRVVRPPRPAAVVIGGVIWAIALLASVAGGPTVLAVIVTPVVVLGVLTSWRNARRVGASAPGGAPGTGSPLEPGPQLWALLILGLTPLAALGGIVGVLLFLLVGAGWTARLSMGGSGRPAVPSTLAAIAPAVAGGFVVLAARQGTELVAVLVIAVLLFDVANALMGTGSTGGLLGAVSGLITVMVFSVMVNALLVPPFTGASSWLLCGVVAVVGPLGVAACGRLVPRRTPALRRLDSLVLVAPLWWLGTIVLIGH